MPANPGSPEEGLKEGDKRCSEPQGGGPEAQTPHGFGVPVPRRRGPEPRRPQTHSKAKKRPLVTRMRPSVRAKTPLCRASMRRPPQ